MSSSDQQEARLDQDGLGLDQEDLKDEYTVRDSVVMVERFW